MMCRCTITIPIITRGQKIYSMSMVPSNKTKKAKFALLSLIKWFPWQPDITFLLNFMLLDEGYIDVSMYGFILIPFNTK